MNGSSGINILEYGLPQVKVFGLVLARVSAMISVAPIFGGRVVPVSLKASFSLILALILTPMLVPVTPVLPDDYVGYGTLAFGEVAVGLILGFTIFLVFIGVQMAGQMLDFQMGMGIMNVINPAMETQAPLVGFFQFIVATLIFLSIEGHHRIIITLFQSFEKVPVTTFRFEPALTGRMVEAGGRLFYLGLQIAAPALITLLLTSLVMAIVGRFVPQINLLIVGFPIRTAVGVTMLVLTLQTLVLVMHGAFDAMWRDVGFMLNHM
ncbi:MAG: flagellar biosynthetic protein FliR [Candidatus Hydrogenedentes bacterium]|nr:flagellar biosynthetic protein FliR [Candidatus Hydrogenedentota bacterium]